MPLLNTKSVSCDGVTPQSRLTNALAFYNQFTQFIHAVRNSPLMLLSICGLNTFYGLNTAETALDTGLNIINQAIESGLNHFFGVSAAPPFLAQFIDLTRAESVLADQENQLLLASLYLPSPFPPPESHSRGLATEMKKFLAFSGLSAIGVPAEVNPWILGQLIRILAEGGALKSCTESQFERVVLPCLLVKISLSPRHSSHQSSQQLFSQQLLSQQLSSQPIGMRYVTSSALISLLFPLIRQADLLQAGLGTALYNIGSCNPLLLIFPNTDKYSQTTVCAIRDSAINSPAVNSPAGRDSPGLQHPNALINTSRLALPGALPYFGPVSESSHYWIDALSSSVFSVTYQQTHGAHCPIPVNKTIPAKNSTEITNDFARATGYGHWFPQARRLVYVIDTGSRARLIDTQGQSIGPAFNFNEPLAEEHLASNVKTKECLSQPKVVAIPKKLTTAAINKSVISIKAASWVEKFRQRLSHLDGLIGFFSRAEAQSIGKTAPFDWQVRKLMSIKRENSPLNRNPNIEQVFPDDYTYDDITRCYKPLFNNESHSYQDINDHRPGLTLAKLVEKMLSPQTQAYLLSDTIKTVPLAISRYYACARLDMSQQPRSWVVNGFVKYIFHLLNIENIFDIKDSANIYATLNHFYYIEASLAQRLKGFITIDSDSKVVNQLLTDIVVKITFPFNLLKNKVYRTHEVRGWKLMLGLAIEQYFPLSKRGRPMARVNEFFYLLTDDSINPAEKIRFRRMLMHPPLCFVIQLMGMDIQHEKLNDDYPELIISLIDRFNSLDRTRVDMLTESSRIVVEQLYAFYHSDKTLSNSDRVDIIRQVLVSSIDVTLQFIVENWFYQSDKAKVKLSVNSIFYNCWVRGASRQVRNNNLFQGGVTIFTFNQHPYYFFIDDSGACFFLGVGENEAKRALLTNPNFFKQGDIEHNFNEKTGYRFAEIEGGLTLSLETVGDFIVNGDYSGPAASFVDHIALSTPRKNKLIGSTFLTRMEDWYKEISLMSFIPLWGCVQSLRLPQHDSVEKIVSCSVEGPTVSMLAHKSLELISNVKTIVSLRPQDLFSELTDSLSTSGTVFFNPSTGITISTEASAAIVEAGGVGTRVLGDEIMGAEVGDIIAEGQASGLITRFHGSSIESFSTYASSTESIYYYGEGPPVALRQSLSAILPIDAIETSVSIEDLSSTLATVGGRLRVDHRLRYSSGSDLSGREEDIKRFLGIISEKSRDRQRKSIETIFVILDEVTNSLLANIPHLIIKKKGFKVVAASIAVMATVEICKAVFLALYNEQKHGGYQDTNIVDFKLKFVDKIKMQLTLSVGGMPAEDNKNIEHEIEITEQQANEIEENGLLPLSEKERLNINSLNTDTHAGFSFNQAVANILLSGLPESANKIHSLSMVIEPSIEPPALSTRFVRVLSLDSANFLQLLTLLYRLPYVLAEQIVECHSSQSPDNTQQEFLGVAIDKYKNQPVHFLYPERLSRQLQTLLEQYRFATAGDYVKEYNAVHRMQYLRLTHQDYLNFSLEALANYLSNNKNYSIYNSQVTVLSFKPFYAVSMNVAAVLAQSNNNARSRPEPTLLFPAELPADIALMLQQYFYASPEQRLGERATNQELNKQLGLGIGWVKSLVTPYLTLPAALFFNSRMVRYGFDKKEWQAMTFTYLTQPVGLLRVLAEGLNVNLEEQLFIRDNRMLRNEFTHYLQATDSQKQEERHRIELYYSLYQRKEYRLLTPESFINRMREKYHAEDLINAAAQVEVIGLYNSHSQNLQHALADKTDNSIIAYPQDWPMEACNEFDVYRAIRYGNLLPTIALG